MLPLLNTAARVPVCGLVSGYNATGLPDGPDRLPLLMATILKSASGCRALLSAVITGIDRRIPAADGALGAGGKIKYREQLIDGLDRAPQA